MKYDGLSEEQIEAIQARDAAIAEAEKEIKRIYANAVRVIILGLGTGILYSANMERIEAARKEVNDNVGAILTTKMAAVSEKAMMPAYKPLLAFPGVSVEYGYQARTQKVITKAMQYERFGKRLSDRIWDASDLGGIEKILKAGYGQDVKIVAKQLETYIRDGAATMTAKYPNMLARMGGRIPKNMAYESLRLARTELATMYRDSVVESCADNPAVIGIRWLLANTHPIPDVCDDYSAHDEGLGLGVFPPDALPDVPHPNCLCAHSPVTRRQRDIEAALRKEVA